MGTLSELRRLRRATGFLSLTPVARTLGVAVDALQRLERSELRHPGDLLERYAAALRADASYVSLLYWQHRLWVTRGLVAEAEESLRTAQASRPKEYR
jgi:transcriptional regulator with XRE-family HTH domain